MGRPDTETEGSTPPESAQSDSRARGEDAKRTSPVIVATTTPAVTEPKRSGIRELAPAISSLIIGFALLLIVVFLLGYLSMQRLYTLNSEVLDSQRIQAARLRLILDLKLAVTRLDNEARARHEVEARKGVKPPFDFRLSTAREKVNDLAKQLEVPPLSEDELWVAFRGDLHSFVEVTRDLRRYSLEGRSMFEAADEKLDALTYRWGQRQDELIKEKLMDQRKALDSIFRWIVIALIVGMLVAVGTIWEVQRRFRQARQSIFEARRERTFTSQLLEGMVSGVAAIDENNRLRSANAAFLEVFPGAVIGASVLEKIGNEDAMKMLTAATETQVTKATYRGRWVIRRSDNGGEKTFDVYSSPIAIDGNQGQIVTLVDATEAAESERGLRRSESLAAVGQATAQVAHEIRNPLGSIRLGVSMLRDSVNDDDALNTIELVERGISHLNKLVVDVTQFSRQKALERSQVDLHDLLDRSLDLVSESINEKQTPVERDFSDEGLTGFWDGHLLQQVFVNLISNAVDASREESPITISTKEIVLNAGGREAGKKYARIAVRDQGKGIDPTKAERIFEPFFSTKKRGTGLGLAIVKQIVERHEGRISVDSHAGKGTTFTVDLPL